MIALSRHALARPRLWLALVALTTVTLGAGLGRLELRTGGDVLRPAEDPCWPFSSSGVESRQKLSFGPAQLEIAPAGDD